jgi:hypothetical protein
MSKLLNFDEFSVNEDFNCNAIAPWYKVVGMSESEAQAKLESLGFTMRVVKIDGENLAHTMELMPGRINVAVSEGKVSEIVSEEQEPKVDLVCMDVPFLIRVMEFAREDAKDDMILHQVAEKMVAMSASKTLTMEDYDAIFPKGKD